jgi:hypothetical protein
MRIPKRATSGRSGSDARTALQAAVIDMRKDPEADPAEDDPGWKRSSPPEDAWANRGHYHRQDHDGQPQQHHDHCPAQDEAALVPAAASACDANSRLAKIIRILRTTITLAPNESTNTLTQINSCRFRVKAGILIPSGCTASPQTVML